MNKIYRASTSTEQFYGIKRLNCVARTQKLTEYTKIRKLNHPIFRPFRGNVLKGPSTTWIVFKKLDAALSWLNLKGTLYEIIRHYRVFSFEFEDECHRGGRHFLVTSLEYFWHYFSYDECNVDDRSFYEVVLSDANGCRLFFDIEYLYEFNENVNGKDMLIDFVSFVCNELKMLFNIECCYENNVIDLVSENTKKFSHHLIFHLPNGLLFTNSAEVGLFVHHCCAKLRERVESSSFFVISRSGDQVLFCDESVYSRNRNFRLFLATKRGQKFPLVLAPECKFYNLRNNVELFDVFCDTLVIPASRVTATSTCLLPSLVNIGKENNNLRLISTTRESTCNITFTDLTPNSPNVENCPFPQLCTFINEHIQKLNANAFVNKWSFSGNQDFIVFQVRNYRFCHRIDREHRSNNVLFVVNLKRFVFYQKCLDPDCRSFRSNELAVPVEFCNNKSIKEQFDEDMMLCDAICAYEMIESSD